MITPRRRRFRHELVVSAAALLLIWFSAAYLLVPDFWKHYARRHPAFADAPRITHTGFGIPGDPLNIGLIASEPEIVSIMRDAGWYRADALGLRSDLRIASATVFRRPYEDAPVSSLYLFGRKQDLAFERLVGGSPTQRHHARLWRTDQLWPDDGRPLWLGSATFDRRVGLSHTTGQITHHTAPNIDAERDYLFEDLQKTGHLADVFYIDDFHERHYGRNGGGDPWFTDGKLAVGVVTPGF